ncbi:MAG TPA: serine/threonine-protein kinase, partial [Xanthomonadales bacterium]|nr:serine/threonine-protein kinase [Xanthomonadales bacterium]
MIGSPVRRLQALFDAAVALPPAERDGFVSRECADDADLARELCALLAADARVAELTADRVTPARLTEAAVAAIPSRVGMRVGPYELREELGHGGMGRVHRAERVDGTVQQEVAIKFLRRELLDANTVKRFQLERQLMATLDHPHIARLIDAAELEDGTPYFVMEYVRGVWITEHARRAKLGVRERVVLMLDVCEAVMEAHRKLVVHRDLKPSNILVTASGAPKLLDFGIAKPLATLVGEATGTAERFFSPHYAAPEQVTGAPVGVACDVYALGALLYELLVEQRPFELEGQSAAQIERLITQVPPAAPSSAIARSSMTDARARARQVRGDLDGIVLRCLRKSPAERYGSVEALATDLRNFLEGRPVQARGGHAWYRARKFVRRNAIAVAAGTLAALSLVAGLLGFAWQARVAQQRAAELEQVSKFQAEMLAKVDPGEVGAELTKDVMARLGTALQQAGLPNDARNAEQAAFTASWARINATDTARGLIDHAILAPAAAATAVQFNEQPLVEAALSQGLADVYVNMNMVDTAAPLQRRALELRVANLGKYDPATLQSYDQTGILLTYQGKLDEAEPYLRNAVEWRRRSVGSDDPETIVALINLGGLLWYSGNLHEAEACYKEVLERRTRLLGPDHPRTIGAMMNLGSLMSETGRLAESEHYLRGVRDAYARTLGEDDPETTA